MNQPDYLYHLLGNGFPKYMHMCVMYSIKYEQKCIKLNHVLKLELQNEIYTHMISSAPFDSTFLIKWYFTQQIRSHTREYFCSAPVIPHSIDILWNSSLQPSRTFEREREKIGIWINISHQVNINLSLFLSLLLYGYHECDMMLTAKFHQSNVLLFSKQKL